VVAPLLAAQAEPAAHVATAAGRRPDRKALAVLLSAALLLTAQYYLTHLDSVQAAPLVGLLDRLGYPAAAAGLDDLLQERDDRGIDYWTYWALVTVGCYLVAPALIVRLAFREPLGAYGLKLGGALADGWVYVVLLAVVLPLVFAASYNGHFQQTYPFYHHPRGRPAWPDLWRWEMLYGLHFLAVEFFFRGFLVHGLRRRFGAYCIAVMVVPYCMVHFGKPLPETLGSLLAGLALGFLSLRTRSIILGTAAHLTVALSMDFASLWQKGWFG
jgi:membrane protease YdiL (CAAX protease family)